MTILLKLWEYRIIRGVIKLILRVLSGKSELNRICTKENNFENSKMLINCTNSIELSKYEELKAVLLCNDQMEIENLVETIFFLKLYCNDFDDVYRYILIDENIVFYDNLKRILKCICEYNILKEQIQQKRLIKFDRQNKTHLELIKKMWYSLTNKEFKNEMNSEWKNLGYQVYIIFNIIFKLV